VYQAWIDPLVVAVVAATLQAWRAGLLGAASKSWVRSMSRIPSLLRLVAVLGFGYFLAAAIISSWSKTGSLRPVLIGSILVLAAFYVLFPTGMSNPLTKQASAEP
jgi:hypothetical protein